jgi:heat shock protein HtpX
MSVKNGISFLIDTEVTPASFEDLTKSIHQHYILPSKERFSNVKRSLVDQDYVVSFTLLGPDEKWYVDVEVRTGRPIKVKMVPSDEGVSQKVLDQLKEDLFLAVQLFEEQVRRTTLYFAWVEGEPVVLEKPLERWKNVVYKLFTESMLMFFILFIAASIILFMFLGAYAPIILVAVQFAMVLFSNRIVAKMGNWHITRDKAKVHIF